LESAVAVIFVDITNTPDRTRPVRPALRGIELHECGAVARGAPPFRSGFNLT